MLKNFIKTYDPANFGLTYALKASISFILCASLSYYFFGFHATVFATNASISIFFINSLDGNDKAKLKYLYLYIFLSCLALPFVAYFYELGWWLVVPTFLWMSFVGICAIFNPNLNKVLSIVNMTGLVALIVQSNGEFDIQSSIYGLIVGGVIASTLRVLHIGTYGKFTKKTYNLLLNDTTKMAQNLFDQKTFDETALQCANHIDSIKKIFANQSANLKDARLIIHHSKAIFYLYKTEDIFYSLISLKRYFINIKDNSLLLEVQKEILHNLNELKNIFKDEKVSLKSEALNKIQNSKFSIFAASLEVLYSKFELIKNGGEDKIKLEKKSSKSLKSIISEINLQNDTVINSLKLALGVSIAIFITQVTKIDHGVWIAIGVLSVSRATSYMTRVVGFDNIKGAMIGICIAFALIYTLKSTVIFVPLIMLFIFLTFYLKIFPTIYFSSVFMATFTLVFSEIKADFLELVVARFADILIGFFVAFGVTFLLFRKASAIKLNSNLSSVIARLNKLSNFFSQSQKAKFIISEKSVLTSLNIYKKAILENDKREFKYFKTSLEIYKNLEEINGLIINLKDYIKSIKHDKLDLIKLALESDIKIISTRFEMIEKKLNKLPYYFYDSVEDKLMCHDKTITYLLNLIASKQTKVMDLI
ncbi:integral membrane protein, YccS/YhfK family [Campylobacter iguaniorum]|uniref:FUSC family protein n=1 Tax=Campylobacter iguaniorum TaxID=1244531 RepID=UPI0007C8CA3E|nr:FUSC family protein [Campylobacter iguaniorum]ANE35615.1 integral membrane protein, YccS/YhfK family [Campylobacter iguaniorum]